MKISHQLIGLGLFAVCSPLARAGEDVTVHFGSPTGSGPIQVLGTNGGLTPVIGLESVEMLGVEFNGRTDFARFLPSSPRLRTDVPGGRIVLPSGFGSLYHYRCPAGPGFQYGFLWVDAQGLPHVVLERSGSGPNGTLDPFVARVAISLDGASFLAATTLAAGGDLLEVDLVGNLVESRTATQPPLDFGPAGLVLGDSFGVGVSSTGVWRFERVSGAAAVRVPLRSPPATWFAREIARSENGSRVITIAGSAANSAHAWILGATGGAVRASSIASTFAGAGFQPDVPNGPFLTVSDDGSLSAWKTADGTGEAWLRDAAVGTAAVQLTQTPIFEDTLEEVGVLTIAGSRLVFGVGEAEVGGGYNKADLFQASMPGGQLVLENLTASSGQTQPPFTLVPEIEPETMFCMPGCQSFVVLDDVGSSNTLLAVDTAGNRTTILPALKDVWLIERVGPNLIAVVNRDLPGEPLQVHRFDAGLAGSLIGTITGVDGAARPTVGDGDWLAFVTPIPVFGEFLWRVDAALGTLERLVPRQLIYGTSKVFTGGGELRLSVGGDIAPAQFVVWPTTPPPFRIGKAATPARLLPGD